MFKKRTIQVSFPKSNGSSDETDTSTPTLSTEDYVRIARSIGKDVVVATAVLVGGYIAADTVRQVIVKNVKFK
jgi:hypothetical protein